MVRVGTDGSSELDRSRAQGASDSIVPPHAFDD
jgi:hypothetical protein